MRRFQFRLERLLEIKRYRERQAELVLAAATARCVELRNRMADAQTRMAGELVARGARAGARLDLEQLRWSEAFRRHLRDVYEASARALVEREKERREAQKVYLDAARERKVLDKLRERRESGYYRDARRREAKALDDVSQAGRTARSREA